MIHASFFELCCIGIALFVTSNIWFYFRVLRPIRRLSIQADQLSQGNLNSFEQRCSGIPEIRGLSRAMSGMVGHVRRAQEQKRVYAEQLAQGQENERKRIARELHDDTIQSLIAITQSIELTKNWLKTDIARATDMLQQTREQAVEVVTRLRNLIGGLRPPALEELGLIPALEMQLEMIQQEDVNLRITGDQRRLDETREVTLFRAAQEALRNIMRHSEATRIDIEVKYQPQEVLLCIQDNGRGFRPPSSIGDLAFKNHYGLLGIQERVTALGGWLEIDSQINKGTTLYVRLPSKTQEHHESLVRDPVCSALIEPQRAYNSLSYKGDIHYFCCPVCQGAFQQDPDLYHDATIHVNMPISS